MYEQDYVLRQIKYMVAFLARIILNKKTVIYELPEISKYTQMDYLHEELLHLIRLGKINEAENLLFEHMDPNNDRYVLLALDFYERLNNLDDEYLEKNSFSRAEIETGLKDIAKELGVEL